MPIQNIATIENISRLPRIHLRSMKWPAPGTSQPAMRTIAGNEEDCARVCAETSVAIAGFNDNRVAGNGSWLHDGPAGIGIEHAHCSCRICCGLPQILLEQHAILVDYEGHDPGVAVLRRIGDESESA